LIILSPLMLLVALFVRLDSTGPVFFRQPCLGKDGKVCTMSKFRTMPVDVDPITGQKAITRSEKILRKVNLDELPPF